MQGPKPQLCGRRKAVTVCVAGIQYNEKREPLIIAASDRRVSIFGGSFSDDVGVKFGTLNRNWLVMFAGDPEHMKLMIDGISAALRKTTDNSHDNVVKVCQAAYKERRKVLVETVILAEYDVSSYAEYKALEQTDEALFRAITDRIDKQQQEWYLLFAGFDDKPIAHVFVIAEAGRVEYCDYRGVGSVGSGALAALLWLSFYGYRKSMAIGQAAFGIVSAKFFAERASDVGEKTIITVLKPDKDFGLVLKDVDLGDARVAWKAIDTKPQEVTDELENTISGHLALYDSFGN
jgi:hypothetical protein